MSAPTAAREAGAPAAPSTNGGPPRAREPRPPTPPPARLPGGAGAPVLPLPAARGAAFVALAAFGALHWMAMLEPAEPGRAWLVVALGAAEAWALVAAARLDGGRRTLAAIAATAALAALGLLAGGVSHSLLRPDRWGELSAGISRGIADMPGVRVPYEGLDQWVRSDIRLGAGAIVLAAAALAFWPRRRGLGRPLAALFLLVVLYIVPAIALDFRAEFLRGAALALLVVAYLRLEKLRAPDTAASAALALGAALVALIAAPAIDESHPWWDYERWAFETAASKSTTYSWNHSYGPLRWPRDGRELLRVKARLPAYWKAENLDEFDGTRWVRVDPPFAADELPDSHANFARYVQRIVVSVRNLRSDTFITAGYALGVDLPQVDALPTLDGVYGATRTLGRGDTYTATVYTPQPTERERRAAGTSYPDSLARYRTILVANAGRPMGETPVTFPPFGSRLGRIFMGQPRATSDLAEVEQMFARSTLRRTYALARRLRAGASTPEDYVQRVLAYLGHGFSYSETPPRSADTLEGFLFDAKTGYCQQFSGAMALLLRMAGIPARIATGFTSGQLDRASGEYVVHDTDAHSWVEAYYPQWGWYTLDPTPALAPARVQQGAYGGSAAGTFLRRAPSFSGDRPALRADGTSAANAATPFWRRPLTIALAVAVLLAATALVRRARRGGPPIRHASLGELQRALRRARREPPPDTTLHALEAGFATPAAAGYVRALREARYGGRPAEPSRAQRRGLRSELARGRGVRGRLRSWWALPPL